MSYKNVIRGFTNLISKLFFVVFCCLIIVSFEVILFKQFGTYLYRLTLGRNIDKEITFLVKIKKNESLEKFYLFLHGKPDYATTKIVNSDAEYYDCIVEDIFRNDNEDNYVFKGSVHNEVLKNEFTLRFQDQIFIRCKGDVRLEKVQLLVKFFKY